MNSSKQAQVTGFSDGRFPVKNLGYASMTVVAQNICLARIDVAPTSAQAPRTVLNLYGVKDIERLEAALAQAKERLIREQKLLAEVTGKPFIGAL